jgi:hypothetical protein
MTTRVDFSNITWNIKIIKETSEGYLVMSPNGDTQWLTKEDYINYLNNKKKNVR